MLINISYDASVASCPQVAAFKACASAVAALYDSAFADPITVNIHLGWGEVDGFNLPANSGAASVSSYTAPQYTYAQIRSAFTADAKSGTDNTAVASLGAADPTSGGKFSMTTAEAKALGLISTTSNVDGYAGIDKASQWVFNVTNSTGANVPRGGVDAFSFLAHEFSEILGRQMNFNSDSRHWLPEDMFDYTASGVRALANSSAAHRYFSINGGASNTGQHWFNNVANHGDLFDYLPNGATGSFLPNGAPDSYDYQGSVGAVSPADFTLMDAIGFDPTTVRNWKTQTSANFSTAANWSGGVPNSTAVAALNASGSSPYKVTASANTTVKAIQTNAYATLKISGGTFNASLGTGNGANSGVVTVASGATLAMGGVFNNLYKLSVASGAVLKAVAGGLTLGGSGILALAGTIQGASAAATFSNGGNIHGSGQLGGGVLTLANLPTGTILSTGAGVLTIDTGGAAVTNYGLIESGGTGGLAIASAIVNNGVLEALSSTLTVSGDVTGNGIGVVGAGALSFTGAFNENVAFASDATGKLVLAHSQTYTGKISGLSIAGDNALDLSDIAYAPGTTQASYSGTTASGTLTVSDGTHTAHIKLVGNYVSAAFNLSAAAGGGTEVVDPQPLGGTQQFAQAIAAFAGPPSFAVSVAGMPMSFDPAIALGPPARTA